jgi:hypothetical protein
MPAGMLRLREHPAAAALVAAVLAATAAVFLLARPDYRPPSGGPALSGAPYPAAVHGWTWNGGTPGDGVTGAAAAFLNGSIVPAELAPARAAAARAGALPASVRPLRIARYGSGTRGFAAILVASDAGGRTCLGFVLPHGPASFLCPPRLGRQRAFVVATAMPQPAAAIGSGHPLFLLAVVSGDVVRATVTQHERETDWRSGAPQVISGSRTDVLYERGRGWWGTFLDTLSGDRPWQATVTLRLRGGRTVRLPIRLGRPGSRLFVAN